MGVLRVLLAIEVIVCHVGRLGFIRLADFKTAVETFFMISGFYMSLILDSKYTGKKSYSLFITNRFLRIFPLYWAVLVISIFGCAVSGLSTGDWLMLTPFVKWHPQPAVILFASVSNLVIFGQDASLFFALDPKTGALFFTPGFFNAAHPFWPFVAVPQAWSLAVELLFYMAAPFILRKNWRVVLGLLLASFLLRVGLVYGLHLPSDPWTYRLFPTEIMFFLAGNISYRLYTALRGKAFYEKCTGFVTVLFFCVFLYLPYPAMREELRAAAYFFLTTICLPFVFSFSKNSKIDNKIAEYSYPIYLVHWAVSHFLSQILGSQASALQVLFMSALVSWALLLKIGEPLEEWRQARWRKAKLQASA